MRKDSKIYIADHQSIAGSAILRGLKAQGYENVIIRTQSQLNLLSQDETEAFFRLEEPEYVFLTAERAMKVGNHADRGDILYENLMILSNVIHQAYKSKVKKLVLITGNSIYPSDLHEPVSEKALLTSPLDFETEPYAIAKIAGLKLCENYNIQHHTNYLALAHANIYGPEDNFNLENDHILPALIRKLHLGKCLEENNWDALRRDLEKNPIRSVGGTALKDDILAVLAKNRIISSIYNQGENQDNIIGNDSSVTIEIEASNKAKYDFLWSDDLADAGIFLIKQVDFKKLTATDSNEIRNTHLNIGTGKAIDINVLIHLVKKQVGFQGEVIFKNTEELSECKITDIGKLHSLGWKHQIEINEGIKKLYEWYLQS